MNENNRAFALKDNCPQLLEDVQEKELENLKEAAKKQRKRKRVSGHSFRKKKGKLIARNGLFLLNVKSQLKN